MARGDKLDGGGANQRIHDLHVFLARDAEDMADALVRETFDDKFSSFHNSRPANGSRRLFIFQVKI